MKISSLDIIYKITNLKNKKIYIGKVERETYERRYKEPLQGRWEKHIKGLKDYK
jgi:hypothetical protein